MKYLIDTHFHLDRYRNYLEVAGKINSLQQSTIVVTNSPGVFLTCKNMELESNCLKLAIGFHPQEPNLKESDLNDFLKLMSRTNFVGEIGLDYSSKTAMDIAFQRHCFERIVESSSSMNKVMTIHIRKAEDDAIEILGRYKPKKAIIHWYTGNEEQLKKLLELNCFFSINSNMVTGKNIEKYRIIPQDRILIESDGPYTKVSGEKFSPEKLLEVYSLIAKYYDDRELIQHVYDNFKRLLLL